MTPSISGAVVMALLAVVALVAAVVNGTRCRAGDTAPTRLPLLVDLLVTGAAAVVAIRGVHP